MNEVVRNRSSLPLATLVRLSIAYFACFAVYCSCQAAHDSEKPSNGIITHTRPDGVKTKLHCTDPQNCAVSPRTNNRSTAAQELARSLDLHQIRYQNIRFDPYTGYAVKLQSPAIEVNFGFLPFDKKVQRLQRLLRQEKPDFLQAVELSNPEKITVRTI